MATPRKNKSGTWSVQVYDRTTESGKRIYKLITRPTKVEAEIAAAEYKGNRKKYKFDYDMTVGEAIDVYLNTSKTENIVPSTRNGYEICRRSGFPHLINVRVMDLNEDLLNDAIITESKRTAIRTGKPITAKTVKNEWGLISAALRKVCKMHFDVDLPQYQKDIKILPEPQNIINAIKGSNVELPCLMAMWTSFTMSELRGLRYSDIINGFFVLRQVKVNVNGTDMVKPLAKATRRKRVEIIPQYIMDLIEASPEYQEYIETGEDNYIIQLSSNAVYNRFRRLVKRYGINMSFHDLRHEFATISASVLHIDEHTMNADGGWHSSHTPKNVYINQLESLREEAARKRNEYFMQLLANAKGDETFNE